MAKPALDGQCLEILRGQKCAVGVSGGSDSLALLLLLQAQTDAQLTAITIDHGLRPEAASEAEYVGKICAKRSIAHVIIKVNVITSGNLPQNARLARYEALTDYCRRQDITILAIGHTLDDQAETFMMASFRGSGVDGLSAMPVCQGDAPIILRPALHLRREALREFLHDRGVDWVEDPTNADPLYDRVRMRGWLAEGEALGFDVADLERTINNMKRARGFLEEQSKIAARALLRFSPYSVEAQFSRIELLALHPELSLRILARLCQYYGGSRFKPRLARLDDLLEALQKPRGGMNFEKTEFQWSEARVRVYAEPAHLPEPSLGAWHNFRLKEGGTNRHMGALGSASMQEASWREWGISARAAYTLPAIEENDQLILAQENSIDVRSFWEFKN